MKSTPNRAVDRQKQIYLAGLQGKRTHIPIDLKQIIEICRNRLPRDAFDYIDGGAGTEDTIKENRRAFDRWRITPRMLVDVSDVNTEVSLFGASYASPFFLCPIGVLELAHPQADLAVARAAADLDIPLMISNQSSTHLESIIAAAPSNPTFFQLYWSKSDDLVRSLVERAEKAGCRGIVVTLDTTFLGWRARDLDNASLPFLVGKGIAQYTSDPVFRDLVLEESGMPSAGRLNWHAIKAFFSMAQRYPGSTFQNLRSRVGLKSVQKFINIYIRPSLTWDDLGFLRSITKLPIILKGILHTSDAKRAHDEGVDAIYVSNHGGRQIDGAIGALDALTSISKELNGNVPILFDSGVRGGSDAYKALALGATMVGIGRPYVYALAAGGEQGVHGLLENMLAEFELTMALCGSTSLSEVDIDHLYRG